jgi:transposase InsO family protein
VVDFVRRWSERSEVAAYHLVAWTGISLSKYHAWRERYGKANEHNAWIPRDHWLEEWEKRAIERFYTEHPLEGYRRLAFMMLDQDVVAVSPSSAYRVLDEAGLIEAWNGKESKKGTGFEQPTRPHEHWHVDVTYLNVRGTFFFQCSVLDGYSRMVVHWEIREAMTVRDVEVVVQRARERFPGAAPRMISDNGPQFIARDFKEFIRVNGMTHVRTSPYYPQSNGKIEAWHKILKQRCIRPKAPGSREEAERVVAAFVRHYNEERLHGALLLCDAEGQAGRARRGHLRGKGPQIGGGAGGADAPPPGRARVGIRGTCELKMRFIQDQGGS